MVLGKWAMRLELWPRGLIKTSSGVLNPFQMAIKGKLCVTQGLGQGDLINISSRFELLARWLMLEITKCKLVTIKNLIANEVTM